MKFRIEQWGRLSTAPLASAMALALVAPLAHAQIQASATLSNLSVRVIDLNTTDKIPAAATWGGALSSTYDSSPIMLTDVVSAGAKTLAEAPFASGTYGGGNISLSTSLGQNDLAQATALPGVYISNNSYEVAGRAVNPDTGLMTSYVDRINSNYTSVFVNVGQKVQSGYSDGVTDLPYSSLTLTPGTVAIVSGDMLTSVTTDSRWLSAFGQQVGLPADNIGSWNDLTATVTANLTMTLENLGVASNAEGGSTTSNTYQNVTLSAVDAFNRNGVVYRPLTDSVDPQSVTSSFSQAISLVVQNLSDQDMVFNLNFEHSALISLDGSSSTYTTQRVWNLASGVPVDVVTPPAPNIPEPGTWMLMGLGMGSVAWARRRHTQQQMAEGAAA